MFPPEIRFGVGTWAWGDRLLWEYGREYGKDDITAAFRRYIRDGVRFFSTSPSFAEGDSERILGEFNARTQAELFIASKYVPRAWHLRRSDFMDSLKKEIGSNSTQFLNGELLGFRPLIDVIRDISVAQGGSSAIRCT